MYWHRLLEEFLNRSVKGSTKRYLPPLEYMQEESRPRGRVSSPHVRIDLLSGFYLTQRESECAYWMMLGCTMKEIADKLKLSPRTVEYYIKRLKERWHCKSKLELLRMLQENGFKSPYEKNVISDMFSE